MRRCPWKTDGGFGYGARMATYARDVSSFYQGEAGSVAGRVLRAHLATLWPDCRRFAVLGLGFAAPYLSLWQTEAASCIDARLAASAQRAPGGSGARFASSPQAVFAADALPLADLSVDRILLVHALELATNAPRLLRECWRVLRDDGRLLAVVPNRMGLWAHVEATPFGEGQPYTQGQITALFGRAMFATERCEHALFAPPLGARAVRSTATAVERLGRRFAPRLGGVILAEAVKDVYAAAPLVPATRRRLLLGHT